ncbi:ras association domain-containing protein 5 isoform X1 [Panthera pardus]|uniref:Ras association domain family member 5 n=5 Tax=Felidae TaxID=9681 RepID=A0ABI7ZKG1_FELCA|nr:ras association domain-containing protein 5 isoform X1 [Felis catus]XP_014925388.2 ras association domain-containing protein 5 isoform X1 [Acinonyx jubatus]XP_019289601.1 ras association domain-containing protein 5 isoform X1 [Panthera pardus]XP_025777059.1 ras association domain-containing protein 5 [Puma concolor]XP_030159368.1 ras association domain-containing protein 5 isoform X1 [Lynx canadensis]XP_040317991.1 ras association domain-containing protein 5 isoform X1 [Puma yagouaroundi]X
MAMASPAIGQRPYPLLLDPEPPRYLQSLSGHEPPQPPPPGRSSRRCAPAPLSTARGAHEGRGARRAARGDPEPQPRASRPARPLRPGLQQRLRRRPGAPRPRDVRSIFEQPQDPRVPVERGEGHRFAELALRSGRGWCDLCGREVLRQALRCANCKFTCHPECRHLIQLDCSQQGGPSQDRPSPESTLTPVFSQNVCKPPEETQRPPTLQEIKQKIDSYNTREKNCLGMKLSEDGTYTGFIKVHLKLRRPVTVPAGIRPQSIYDAIKEVNLAATTDKRTSFYLPLDAIKQLHISSTTTVSEVIQGLLKKFMVVDNPQKFALFKRIHKDGQVLFQKLSIADCPLYLRLLAGPDNDVLSFVLKENETGEVEWDAFSIPELQNFLTILEKEEQDKIQQVQKKYDKFRQKLEEALRESQGKPG